MGFVVGLVAFAYGWRDHKDKVSLHFFFMLSPFFFFLL